MCEYCADELLEMNKILKEIQHELHVSNKNKQIIVSSMTEILTHMKIEEIMESFAEVTSTINSLNKELSKLKNNQTIKQENNQKKRIIKT